MDMQIRFRGKAARARGLRLAALPVSLALIAACSDMRNGETSPARAVELGAATSTNSDTAAPLNRAVAGRFPGATFLGEAEFASAIVGRTFSYREVGSEFVLQRPKEVFVADGQYRIHWSRAISYGTWSMARGIVSIDCPDCRYGFIGLSRERVFFRHQGRLLTANANGEGGVVELIRDP